MTKGALIVIEGPDGVGKQTQCELLRKRLVDLGRDAKVFSFHRYATPLGRLIKAHLIRKAVLVEIKQVNDWQSWPVFDKDSDAMMFQCLASADKYEAAPEIQSFIDQGGIAICDRWWQSSYAYGRSDGLDGDWLIRLHQRLPEANLNLLIELPHGIVRERKPVPDDRYEASIKHQEEVRLYYDYLWNQYARPAWRLIDGTGAVADVHDRIWNKVCASVWDQVR